MRDKLIVIVGVMLLVLLLVFGYKVISIAIGPVTIGLQPPVAPTDKNLPVSDTAPTTQNTPPLTCQNALRNVQSYAVGQTISGPATLHPLERCTEMANQLGLACVGYWGINVKSGQSIIIPESVTLAGGKIVTPPHGDFSTYESDNQLDSTQVFWLSNCR